MNIDETIKSIIKESGYHNGDQFDIDAVTSMMNKLIESLFGTPEEAEDILGNA